MTIKIIDYTKSPRAVSAIDGETVFSHIQLAFQNNEVVILDFAGIELTITAFLNSSIGNLYASFDSDKIKSLLQIINLAEDELPLLKFVIDNAKQRFGKQDDNTDIVHEA